MGGGNPFPEQNPKTRCMDCGRLAHWGDCAPYGEDQPTTNETRTPSPHMCPSCKASFTDDGEFGAHMGGQCTPSPAETAVVRPITADDMPIGPVWEADGSCWRAIKCDLETTGVGWRWQPLNVKAVVKDGPEGEMTDFYPSRSFADHCGIVEVDQADFDPADFDRVDARGLVERLRETWCGRSGMSERHSRNPDGPEAADLIEAQSATIAGLREERDALLEKPIDLAKMDSIDDELTDQMISYFWWERSNELTATIARLNAEVERMREAGLALVAKLDECQPHIENAGVFMHVHGMDYSGPQYGEALEELRALLTCELPQPTPESYQIEWDRKTIKPK